MRVRQTNLVIGITGFITVALVLAGWWLVASAGPGTPSSAAPPPTTSAGPASETAALTASRPAKETFVVPTPTYRTPSLTVTIGPEATPLVAEGGDDPASSTPQAAMPQAPVVPEGAADRPEEMPAAAGGRSPETSATPTASSTTPRTPSTPVRTTPATPRSSSTSPKPSPTAPASTRTTPPTPPKTTTPSARTTAPEPAETERTRHRVSNVALTCLRDGTRLTAVLKLDADDTVKVRLTAGGKSTNKKVSGETWLRVSASNRSGNDCRAVVDGQTYGPVLSS